MAKGRNYLYTGPEIGERNDALQALRKALAKAAGFPPEEHSFYCGETKMGDVASLLRNASLFCEQRLILLKNAEHIKKKEDVDLLCDYLAAPADDTVLVLLSDEISVDKKIDAAIPKDSRRIFWELFEDRKTEWVGAFFRREGYRISPNAIESILELVENNTEALRRECSRLLPFLKKDRVIEEAEIENLLAHTREESAFSLFARIAEGDLARALETVRSLLAAKEVPVQILAGLLWCFRRLGDYIALVESGRCNDFELKKAGLSSKKAQRDYVAAAKRYSARDVELCVALLAKYDIQFRSSGSGVEDILMDTLVYALLIGRGKALERASYSDV